MKFLNSVQPIHVVLALLLVIAGITAFVLLSEPPAGATGVPHETIAGLSVGGDAGLTLEALGSAPFYFQIAVILLSGVLLYMGVAAHRRDHRLRLFFLLGIGFAIFSWVALFLTYELWVTSGKTTVFMGFPTPTNWMFWGIWGSFAAFDLFYVIFFRRYFLPPEDEQAFNDLMDEIKAEGGDA
ncbi:hypothetical protein [Kordiimonas lacus]|uniref:Uncharacterized protein n=1 Tax=Kordiimonas lacus TaxID=637679 RepID=A0A1G6ZKB8_9PROT|nr:hypothetical protein [Kordiimonas lacus]SDE02853.1 hypothetical protein SAMN04488071_1844 [Kordiimonas lacus]